MMRKPEGRSEPRRFLFTTRALQAIAPPAQGEPRRIVYDTKVPKLACRVASSGTRPLYLVVRIGERMEWIKLGTLGDDITVEQARAEASKHLGQFAQGKNPAQVKREAKAEATVGEGFEAYVKDRELRGVKRLGDLRQVFERCIGEIPENAKKRKHGRARTKHPQGVNWQRTKLSAITHEKVKALHAAIGTSHPTMANRVVELISALFNFLKLDNPAKGIEPFKETSRERFLREAELPRFFAALSEDTSQDFKDFVKIALLTGARSGNVRAMRFEDVDIERAVWTIPGAVSKNGAPMDLPLVAEVLAIVKARREGNPEGEFVFPAASKSGFVDKPKKKWRALLARAKLSDLRLHDLRRSLGSWQAILGTSLHVIGRSLGHKDASSTAVYARLSMDPVRAAVEAATSTMLAHGKQKGGAVVPISKGRGKKS